MCTGTEMSLQEIVMIAFMFVGIFVFWQAAKSTDTWLEPNKPKKPMSERTSEVYENFCRNLGHMVFSAGCKVGTGLQQYAATRQWKREQQKWKRQESNNSTNATVE